MKKDKHKFPNTEDTFANEVKRAAREKQPRGILYAPDSRPISSYDVEASSELGTKKKRSRKAYKWSIRNEF